MIKTNMKYSKPIVLSIIFILTSFLFVSIPIVRAEYDFGDGTLANPYQISNWVELYNIRNNLSESFILVNDLDSDTIGYNLYASNNANDGNGWLPIGTYDNGFTGTFDGQDNTISNLFIDRNTDDIGIFGDAINSTIKNVNIDNADVTGNWYVGGIVGYTLNCTIKNVNINNINVTGQKYIGGLIGYNAGNTGIISNCYTKGTVIGNKWIGGLTGTNDEGLIKNSYSKVNVVGIYTFSDSTLIGGLSGDNWHGTIENSYAKGNVSGVNTIGGFVGENDGSMINCYSTGIVDGNDVVGGFIGSNNSGMVKNCFYDNLTSRQNDTGKGKGLWTIEMKNFTTFNESGWDIVEIEEIEDYNGKIWYITDDGNHYPHLGWELNYVPNNPPENLTYLNPSSDNATNVPKDAILKWSCDDPDGDPLTFEVYFGTDPNPPRVSINQSGTTYDPALDYNTTYYWKIKAWDNYSNTSGLVWSFTTEKESSNNNGGGGGSGGGGGGLPPSNKAPIADASASEHSGLVNTPVTFDGSNSYDEDGEITNYTWAFGDGTSGYGNVTTHVYVKTGIYNVKLTVTDNDNENDTDSIKVIISQTDNQTATLQIDGPNKGKQNIEYNFTVSLTNSDDDNIKYLFYWGDDQTNETDFNTNTTEFIQKHKWINPGFFKIEVFALNINNETVASAETNILIDIYYCKNIGYFIDEDSNGIYDSFYSNQTRNKTITERLENGSYLINNDMDSDWDYIYNMQTGKLSLYSPETEPGETETDNTIFYVLAIVVIIILLLLFAILGKKPTEEKTIEKEPKQDTKKEKPKKQTTKKKQTKTQKKKSTTKKKGKKRK